MSRVDRVISNQSQSLMVLSQPAVSTLLVSCGCQSALMHTFSCAWKLVSSFVVFQSQMKSLPSASPEIR